MAENKYSGQDVPRWAKRAGILALFVVILTGFAGTRFAMLESLENLRRKGNLTAEIIAGNISTETSALYDGVKIMSGSPWIYPALITRSAQDIQKANSVLDRYNSGIEGSVSYLLDAKGMTIASSNRNSPESFIGRSYEFRPYFQEAFAGKHFSYFAMGVTSKLRGFYASHPVYDPATGGIAGVAAMKKDLDYLEDRVNAHKNCFFVSPEGVIFLSSDPMLRFKSVGPISYDIQNKLLASRQFGDKPFEAMMAKKPENGDVVNFRGRFYVASYSKADNKGWSVFILAPMTEVFAVSVMAAVTTLFFVGLVVTYLLYLKAYEGSFERLKESEDKFKLLSDATNEGVIIHEKGIILESNRRFAEILGYDLEEVIGSNVFDHIHPEDRQKARDKVRAFYEEPYEIRGLKRDGASVMLELCGKSLRYKGKETRVVAVRDVTAYKEMQDVLERVAQEWVTTFNSIPDLISIHDRNYRIIRANKAFADFLGMRMEEVIGKTCYEVIHKTKAPVEACPFMQVLKNREKSTSELFEPRLGVYLEVTAAPLYNEAGEVMGIVHVAKDVTVRRKMEEALKSSENKFKTLFESSRDAIMLLTPDKGFFSGNSATIKMFACRDEAEFVKQHPASLSPEYQPDGKTSAIKAQEMMAIAMEKGSHFFEWTHKRLNGQDFFATVLLTRMELEGKTVLQATVRDITESKKGEEALKDSEKWLSMILDSLQAGVMLVDAETHVIAYINSAAENMFGAKKEVIVGNVCHKYVCPAEKGKCPITDLGKEVDSAECILLDNEGKEKPILKTVSKVYFKGRLHLVESFIDMVKLKEAQEEIKFAHSQLEQIFQNAAEGMVVIDAGHMIVKVNRTMLGMLGIKEEEARGKRCDDILNNEICKGDQCVLERILGGEKQVEADIAIRSKNGVIVPCILTAVPFYGPDGSIVGVIESFKDITERKSAENALIENIKLKTNFTSMVSHELRTPLTAIKEGISIVLDGSAGPVNDEQKDFLGTAFRNVERLARLINDVLDFSKLRSGKMVMKMKDADVPLIIQEVVKANEPLASSKGLYLRTSTEGEIPRIKLDRDRIIQVIINLLSNASKFTEKGGITITACRKDEEVIVSVEDTGPGIKAADIPKLFAEFRQLEDAKTRKTGGTGLGLAICKQIVERHGGRIWVESEEGKGSAFRFSLPVERRYKVLIVDDDANFQKFTGKLLLDKGYTVQRAVTGAEGVEAAKGKPDLIVLDMRLPDMNGYEVIGRLQSDEDVSGIPVLAVSGYEDELKKLDRLKTGVFPRMTKPFNNEEFLKKIKILLSVE